MLRQNGSGTYDGTVYDEQRPMPLSGMSMVRTWARVSKPCRAELVKDGISYMVTKLFASGTDRHRRHA